MRHLLPWVSMLVIACGSDGSSSTSDDCASYCAKQPTCGDTPGANCEAVCGVAADLYNPAYWGAFLDCYLAADPCDVKTDDTCAGQAFVGLSRRSIDDEFRTQCEAMKTRCGIVCHPGEPDLDACNFTVVFSESSLTSAEACLDRACGEVCACLDSVLMY